MLRECRRYVKSIVVVRSYLLTLGRSLPAVKSATVGVRTPNPDNGSFISMARVLEVTLLELSSPRTRGAR